MKKYTVDLLINSSHSINEVDFHGGNMYKISDNEIEYDKFISSMTFRNECPETEIQKIFEKVAQIASLAVSKDERNQAYGCPYFTVNWASANVEQVQDIIPNNDDILYFEDHLSIREYVNMTSTRVIPVSEINEYINNIDNYNFLVENFYHGLMSNNVKSKFFSFFIIIESIEGSNEFRGLFETDLLFNVNEKNVISEFINQFDARKKVYCPIL
ncbi:hypothetical protein FACS1894172_14780 [Spirochaetia bacterium]|nr:hypothetical protein FACS1894164_16080 [Spirochaetia bacterium]GHU34467.1 hypothetical protein FACS1894172_14780 [Spirochaetia bacterium]